MNPMKQQEMYKLNEYRRRLKRTPKLLNVSEQAYRKALSGRGETAAAQAVVSMFVLGPVLLSFSLWTLKQAEEAGKRRLYFLARDGWMMYQMARYLCERKALSIECRYLYASRYAWRIPEQHLIGEKAMERICRGGLDVTFAAMMRRAGLTKEEGSRIAALIRPGRKETDILSWKEIQNLRGPLSSCREFIELADFHSRECYGDTLSYLEQEGLLDAVPYGVVDSGWIGTMQESLQHLLEGAGCGGEVEGYYFGLYNLPRGADRRNFHGFYFEPDSGAYRKARFANSLFECIFTAPHGMTQTYVCRNGRWEPKLASVHPANLEWIKRQLDLLELYIKIAAGLYSEGLEQEAGELELQGLLESFMSSPSKEEAVCYGRVLFSDDVTEERMQPLAAKLTQRQFWEHHPLPRLGLMLLPGKRKLKDSGWIEGSIRLYAGNLYGWHRMGAILYKYALYARMQHGYKKG